MTIDAATFSELQDSAGADFVKELVAAFLEDAPKALAELRSAWDTKSADRFRRAAHSLKSNGQTFGATEFAESARQLELSGMPEDAAQLEALQLSYEASALALQELCRG